MCLREDHTRAGETKVKGRAGPLNRMGKETTS